MKVLNFFGFLAFIYVSIMTASAHSFNPSECEEFAKHTYVTGVHKQQGMTIEQIAELYKTEYMDVKPDDSYLQDESDVIKVGNMMAWIYEHDVTPEQAATFYYTQCMKQIPTATTKE